MSKLSEEQPQPTDKTVNGANTATMIEVFADSQ